MQRLQAEKKKNSIWHIRVLGIYVRIKDIWRERWKRSRICWAASHAHMLFHLTSITIQWHKYYNSTLQIERLNNFPQIIQPVKRRAEIWTWFFVTSKPMFFLLHHPNSTKSKDSRVRLLKENLSQFLFCAQVIPCQCLLFPSKWVLMGQDWR